VLRRLTPARDLFFRQCEFQENQPNLPGQHGVMVTLGSAWHCCLPLVRWAAPIGRGMQLRSYRSLRADEPKQLESKTPGYAMARPDLRIFSIALTKQHARIYSRMHRVSG
jgi:hypothetical protein